MSYASEVLADSPLVYYRLGDASGTTATDSSGNGRNGTYVSSPTLGVTGALTGDSDTAITVSGGKRVDRFSEAWMAVGTWSVEVWVKPSTVAAGTVGIGARHSGTDNLSWDLLRVGSDVQWRAKDSGGVNTYTVTASGVLSTSAWTHLLGTYDGANLRLYVNGTQVGGNVAMTNPLNATAGPTLTVGALSANYASLPFSGSLDEFAYYGTALSGARAAAHYAAGTTAGGTTVSGGQSTESDTAQPGSAKVSTITTGSQVTEADAAQAGSAKVGSVVTGSQGSEADTGQAGTVRQGTVLPGSQGTETDTANTGSVTAGSVVPGGQGDETDAAQPGALLTGEVVSGGVAVESDVANAGTVVALGPIPSDTSSRTSGRNRSGHAAVSWTPTLVPPPSVMVSGAHRRIGATARGPVTMQGTQPTYAVSRATRERLRLAIFVGGKDISFLRDVPTPDPGYQLAEPLRWGPSTIELPQIAAAHETLGELTDISDLRWCAKGKPVVYKLVDDTTGEVHAITYRGLVVAHDTAGRVARLEVGGHAQGRATLEWKPEVIFRDVLDIGRLAWAAIRDLGLAFEPRLGPTTGIKSAHIGNLRFLPYLSELCAKAWQRDGSQWTIMPDDAGTYRMFRKDTETIHFTVFCDDTHAVASLRSDLAEETTEVYASGVTPKGQRVRFGVYPNLEPGPAAPYPFDDDRVFGLGTLDEDADTGDGVTVMVKALWGAGYLSLEDADGSYDADVTRALMSLQERAGLAVTGNMNPATWLVLFDLNTTGYTTRGAQVEPAAQDIRTQRYLRSASGRIIGKNPLFDRKVQRVGRAIEFGSGLTRHEMREHSRAEVARFSDPDFVTLFGTIQINTGAVLAGDVPVGTTITPDMLLDVRDLTPGMNGRIHHGGRSLPMHLSVVDVDAQDSPVTTARLTVDTQARDAPAVWESIKRNRETLRDPARRWHGGRASSTVKDSIVVWDEVGGIIRGNRTLKPGWNRVKVVAAQAGTIAQLRLVVQSVTGEGGEIAIEGREFACAVFGNFITEERLNHLVPAPLTLAGERAWRRRATRRALAGHDLRYSAGSQEEPCGYGADLKTDGATLTGEHDEDAGFSYGTEQNLLYLMVWVAEESTLLDGRIMWPQLEAGV